jgi:hypothetical protein
VAAYDPAEWSNFAIAQLGASSVLLGLVFVGVSINLGEIVGSPLLVRRAGEAILVLGSVLVASTCVARWPTPGSCSWRSCADRAPRGPRSG